MLIRRPLDLFSTKDGVRYIPPLWDLSDESDIQAVYRVYSQSRKLSSWGIGSTPQMHFLTIL